VKRNVRADVLALAVLHSYEGEWLCALEAAERLGVPYRPLAFALRRLVRAAVAQERVAAYRGASRSREERREYRLRGAVPGDHPFLPPVHLPPPGVARRIKGRYSLN